MICSLVNLAFFIRPSLLWADSTYEWRKFRGHVSVRQSMPTNWAFHF